MIFLDSSALLKLVHLEHESAALKSWLESGDGVLVASELAKVELLRACRRRSPPALPTARALLALLHLLPLTGDLLEDAAGVGEPLLRSLDAIHLASALSIRDDVTAFVAYDQRLADAARAAGLVVVQPGARASH